MKKKIYFSKVGIKFDFINHNYKHEFVDSGLYFDENDFIYPLLQVESGSNEKK